MRTNNIGDYIKAHKKSERRDSRWRKAQRRSAYSPKRKSGATSNDNGVATTVVPKKGIDLQPNESIRPILRLKPYRTFQEVEQPESQFLIRINERGITFAEADGGMWKLKARETVKAYLKNRLAAEIESGAVVVAL